MSQNTKILIIINLLIIMVGVAFFWMGFKNKPQQPLIKEKNLEVTQESTPSASVNIDEETGIVSKVVDGDTIELQSGQTVRFIGIDTPETVDPRRPVGCFGKEASNKTKSLLLGKQVLLKKDVSETDKYKRLLRYIYLPLDDGTTLFVNDYLVREGYAKNYTYPPDVKFNEQFKEAERQAREAKKGLWGRC